MNVRTSEELDRLVGEAADRAGVSRADWIRERLRLAAMEEAPREVKLQRPPAFWRLCGHPLQVRSRKDADGQSKCMRCGTRVRV